MMHSLVLLDIQTEIYADQRKFEFTEHRLTESDISASLKGMSILQQPSNVTTSEPSNNIPIQPKLVNSLQQIDSLLFVLITYLSNKDEVFLQTQFMSLFITIVLPIQNLKYAPFLIFPLLQNENLQNSIFGQLFQLAFANPQTPINIVVITVDYISSLLCYSQSIQPIFTEQILTALLQISNELLLVNNSRLEQKFDLNTPGAQRAILSVRAFVRIVSFAWKTISIQQFESGVKALLLSQIFSFIGGFVEDFSRILINIGAFEADVIQCVAEQAQHRYSIDIFEQGLLGRIQLQKSSAFIEDLYRDDMDLGDE
ncbi:putative RNA polymerase I specific transcription initiation factor RRN3 family protein [Spironucleus salmonicida]|uniref:RNA polymerase I specific transcription initiation factor RRN3 family protein n=2 Tax=Spironucleus salmonicida TaxID=348837 RepID=A0A9P8S188_9EUKA|nr:putative RNA polymerase I specific transcription initiation factor RRN3 family protein [Spironucleus salmonicida]